MTEVTGAAPKSGRTPNGDALESAYDELRQIEALQNLEDVDSVMRDNEGTGDKQAPPSTRDEPRRPGAPETDSADGKGSEKPMGRANLLKYLKGNQDDLPDGAAAQVEGDQRTISRLGAQNRELQQTLQEVREEIAELRGATQAGQNAAPRPGQGPRPATAETEEDKLLENMTPQQGQLLHAFMRKHGYVTQEALDANEEARKADSYTQESIEKSIERWGEAFGARDEQGNFQYHEEIAADMQSTLNRVTNEQGVSPGDLFVLTYFDQLLEQARDEGRASASDNRLAGKRARAQTMTTSAPAGSRPAAIYDKASGDTGDDVMDRALLESFRELGAR